jgi:hypothetical protein
MSRPPDDLPTTVIPQQTVEQPAVSTAPATRRSRVWQRKLPQRIGRARTSTVIIGCLFVLLGGLNFVLPEDPYVDVPLPDGSSVRVRSSQYTPAPAAPTTTTAPAPTSRVPSTTTSAPTSTRATTTAPEEDEEETGTTTAPATTPRSTTTPTPTSTRSTTSRAPSTTATPEETDEEQAPEETADPTG